MRLLPLAVLLSAIPAHAVFVRGTVTGPFGQPVPGARIQLIALAAGTRSLADTVSGTDGTYEIRTDLSGRFLLLTTSAHFAPQVGTAFYAGRTDLVNRDIALDPASLTPLLTTLPNNLEGPPARLSTPITQIPADHLLTRALIPEELPQTPATFLVQTGQQGQPAALYVRGANPDATAVVVDGIQAQSLSGGREAGRFNFGSYSTTGLAALSSAPAVELLSGPNPLQAPAAEAATVTLATPRATTVRPVLEYSGDAGTLHTWRDEAAASLTHRRADLFAAFSRFDTSNALPAVLAPDRFHIATAALNAGYNIAANTSLRLTARNENNAAPLPIPYDLGITQNTRDAAQNLYSAFTFDTRTARDWHNQLRYGLARKREQILVYTQPTARLVTLRAANGATATGVATLPILPTREDQATNRDEITWQTDSPLLRNPNHPLIGLFTARYQTEHALDAATSTPTLAAFNNHLSRTNLTFAAAFEAQFKYRLFASLSGSVNHANQQIGLTGSPRLGLTYTPVYQGPRRFKGTTLHLTAATGSREPSLQEFVANIRTPARARTFEFSADQNLYGRKLILHAGYFHSQFSHQTEVLAIAPLTLSPTQAFRASGFTADLRYQPLSRLFLHGGYTYLATLIEQSAATSSLYTPTLGLRPFHRPPHTGFFAIQYTGRTLTAALQASLAGRSDDSTFTPTLRLPTKDADFGYTRLDAGLTYALRHNVMLFTQLTNLLDDQHIGPIGYPGTPFTIRAGLKFRFGGD